jgi:aminoglycoside phosphotransferase (APT) family kinase protein
VTSAAPRGLRGLDLERVERWAAEHAPQLVAPFTASLIAGGRSNLTYRLIDAAGAPCVLRRPPVGQVLASAHDMLREYRLISALYPAGLPTAQPIAACDDLTVNDAPFYLMSEVDGVVLDTQASAEALSPQARGHAADQLVDVLCQLHDIDIDAVGLGDLARRDGFLERQLKRWSMQWEKSKTRELPAIDEVERRLRANPPPQQSTAIVHGDYRFGNVMVSPSGELRAVLDWELCTLGDPLADLGWMCIYWTDPGQSTRQPNDPSGLEGFPTKGALIDRYCAASGRDVRAIAYYEAFAMWRLAVISEGVYARYLHGQMGDDGADISVFADGTVRLANSALEALASPGGWR